MVSVYDSLEHLEKHEAATAKLLPYQSFFLDDNNRPYNLKPRMCQFVILHKFF